MRKKLGVEKRDEFLKMFCHNKKERTGVPAAWYWCLHSSFLLARQVLYHLEHSTGFLPQPAWMMILPFMLPAVAGITDVCHCAQLFLLRHGFP
jgi:hypothetical protein